MINIRHATLQDLDAITEVEAKCFPPAEAASREVFEKRLEAFADFFWLLEENGTIISIINGMATNTAFLRDEMFARPQLHDANGEWQMIFGVMTLPEYQGKGYAGRLMQQVIKDCRQQGRKGIVLTCKPEKTAFYEKFGYINEGKSMSKHGGAVWMEMRLSFMKL